MSHIELTSKNLSTQRVIDFLIFKETQD